MWKDLLLPERAIFGTPPLREEMKEHEIQCGHMRKKRQLLCGACRKTWCKHIGEDEFWALHEEIYDYLCELVSMDGEQVNRHK